MLNQDEYNGVNCYLFFFSSRRRHTRSLCDWSSDVCSSDLFGVNTRKQIVSPMSPMPWKAARDRLSVCPRGRWRSRTRNPPPSRTPSRAPPRSCGSWRDRTPSAPLYGAQSRSSFFVLTLIRRNSRLGEREARAGVPAAERPGGAAGGASLERREGSAGRVF